MKVYFTLFRWEERQEFQKKQIEKEQFLLKCIEDQRKEFIEAYEEKVRRETERMKSMLLKFMNYFFFFAYVLIKFDVFYRSFS